MADKLFKVAFKLKKNDKQIVEMTRSLLNKEFNKAMAAGLATAFKKLGSEGGSIYNNLKVVDSKFENDDLISKMIIVEASSQAARWEDSDHAKIIFFEYGRSAAGSGKERHGGPTMPRSAREQAPHPFLRPAFNKIKRELKKIKDLK
jgi:hypothetical protein